MNSIVRHFPSARSLIAAAVASTLLTACASAPPIPAGSADVRGRLAALQADPQLAGRAPVAIREADAAVQAAETPEADEVLAAHRVFMADRKVESARALAQTSLAEDERTVLARQRENARLDARTREADAAKDQAVHSRQLAAELQQRIDEMNAEVTDRGIVLTLGDVLFPSGKAELVTGSAGNLDKLISFLGKYPDRVVAIEGNTDNVGSEESNHRLSERRAESVKTYLVVNGVAPGRLTASGRGESNPVADNESATGRQQNRRVEVIISSPATVSR